MAAKKKKKNTIEQLCPYKSILIGKMCRRIGKLQLITTHINVCCSAATIRGLAIITAAKEEIRRNSKNKEASLSSSVEQPYR